MIEMPRPMKGSEEAHGERTIRPSLPSDGEGRDQRLHQTRARTRSDVIVTSVGAGAGVLLMGASIGAIDARIGAFIVMLAPITMYCAVRLCLREPVLVGTPQAIVAVGFTAFYWSGLLIPRTGLKYLYSGTTDFADVLAQTMRLTGVAIAMLAAMEAAALRPKPGKLETPRRRNRRLVAVSQLFMAGSLIGLIATVSKFNGFAAAQAALSSHNKLVSGQLAGTLGLSLWSICVMPAGVLIAALLTHRRTLISRWLSGLLAGELAILLLTSVIVFGGRLVPLTILIGGAAAFYHHHRKPFRVWLISLVALAGLLLSFQVIATRTSEETSKLSVSELVSYNVFDVSMATLGGGSELKSAIMSPERWSTLLLSALPVVGPSPAEVRRLVLDVLVVQDIGTSEQARTTGFPPGLPTASLLMTDGVVGGMLLAALIGGLIGVASARLLERPGLGASVAYAFLCTFTFETFKSGDIASTLAAYAKLGIYLGIAYVVAACLPWTRPK